MNKQTQLSIAFVVLLGLVFFVAALPHTFASGPTVQNSQAVTSWEYARLVIQDDLVGWQAGESNQDIQAFSLDTQYRRLGGNARPSFTNLLNLVGDKGWELVTTDEINWTFKRQK